MNERSEAELQKNVAIFLRIEYPEIIFHSDFGSGVKLHPYQAKMQKLQNGGKRAWPDMFIAKPRFINGEWKHGLFIELKKYGTRLKKKNGEWATYHIEEQAEVLKELEKNGYVAKFAIGFDEVVDIIDEYMGRNNEH